MEDSDLVFYEENGETKSLGYKVNNKWSIRSGVHIQEISFSNSQISVVSSKSNNTSIAFNSGDRFKLQDASVENLNAETLSLSAVTIDGNLDQKYGYIEIPIEIKYNLLEVKKLKTELIAGFSSLFLNKNTIRLNADSLSRSGEATNLNNVNFITGCQGAKRGYVTIPNQD